MRIFLGAAVVALYCTGSSSAFAEDARTAAGEDLSSLSIEQLANIKVRTASKRAEPLSAAPAALYVIDHEQIVRSGAVTIPQILRLAPNLQVFQASPSNWVVTARGLGGEPFTQSFSNKLLVLIDGRTIYTPLFSGVYWDLPDLLPDDIDRVEVISGPGATLWGANAVNGVINIITRSAASTSGAFADVEAGTREQVFGARLAGQASDQLHYRVYGRLLREDAFHLASGGSASDGWRRLGAGFRTDWTPGTKDTVTLEGDIFTGREDVNASARQRVSGRDLLARWVRDVAPDESFQIETFYDRIARGQTPTSPAFHVDTYDVDLQHSLPIGNRNQLVWGGGARIAAYRVQFTPPFHFVPGSRSLFLANLFVQDTLAVSQAVSLTAGIKAERDPYVGTSLLPDVRLAIRPSKTTLLWAAISDAVRSPTPFDEDAQERVANIVALSGNPHFRTEKLRAYELGLRSQPMSELSFSVTGFYHRYDDLRTIDLTTGPASLDLMWGNGLAGHTYGLEAWANFRPIEEWTLSAGATLQQERFHFKPGPALASLGTWQNGVDPAHYFTMRSSLNLGQSVNIDVDLRVVGHLDHSDVPAYAELGGRLAFNVSKRLALSLSGSNLLHRRHVEYPGGDGVPRTILAGLQWRR